MVVTSGAQDVEEATISNEVHVDKKKKKKRKSVSRGQGVFLLLTTH